MFQMKNYELDTKDFLAKVDAIKSGGEGCLFLHLQIKNWNKSVLLELRSLLELCLQSAYDNDVASVSFLTDNEKTIRFANMVRPVDYKNEYSSGQYALGWFSGV